jgi:hypothetical protein
MTLWESDRPGESIGNLGEDPVPTNISLSIADRRDRDKKNAADLTAILFLIPIIACLVSISLCFECHAFECAVIQMADE